MDVFDSQQVSNQHSYFVLDLSSHDVFCIDMKITSSSMYFAWKKYRQEGTLWYHIVQEYLAFQWSRQ